MSEKLFTQDEVNQIIKERVAREKRSFERELEELRQSAASGEPEYKAKYLDALRRTELIKAGFSLDSVSKYMPAINKTDDPDEIKHLAKTFADLAGVSPSAKAQAEHAKKKAKFNPFK